MRHHVIFENLSKRQKAYREVCERFAIEIGDTSNSGGEDAALYFTVLNEGVECAPEQEVCLYCVVTCGEQDIHYAYADFDRLADAKRRAVREINDAIYAERPVEIVNLDTGRRYLPLTYDVKWGAA